MDKAGALTSGRGSRYVVFLPFLFPLKKKMSIFFSKTTPKQKQIHTGWRWTTTWKDFPTQWPGAPVRRRPWISSITMFKSTSSVAVTWIIEDKNISRIIRNYKSTQSPCTFKSYYHRHRHYHFRRRPLFQCKFSTRWKFTRVSCGSIIGY